MRTKLLITRRETSLLFAGALASIACPSAAQQQFAARPSPARNLLARPANAVLRNGKARQTTIWSLDGAAQGPVLRAKVGEECIIPVQNQTPLPLSLHWHGARIANAMDGVGGLTQAPIAPGGSFTYRFTPKETGTWLIRPCVIGATSEPTGRGLNGMFIIEEATPPGIDASITLLVDDWLLDENGQLMPFERTTRGRLGNLLTVNGKTGIYDLDTHLNALTGPASRVLVRIANACNARSFRLRFDRMKAYVTAVDGQPTEAFEPLKSSLPFSPGNRYDIILDLPADGPAAAITALVGQDMPLLACSPRKPGKTATQALVAPTPNPQLPQTIRLQDALRVDAQIHAVFAKQTDKQPDQTAPVSWSLGKESGSPKADIPLFSVKSGRPVVLAIENKSMSAQPIHVHGHCFRLLHPFDDGWDPFWMDTLLVPAKTTVRIALIAGAPGKWLIASTICEHFDTGLWNWFEVV